VSDNLSINEPTAEQLAAATAALAAGPQPTAPVVEAPVVVEAPAPVVEAPVVVEAPAPVVEAPVVVEAPAPVVEAPVVDEKVDFWANSWFSRNKQ
jgi:ribonuclease E